MPHPIRTTSVGARRYAGVLACILFFLSDGIVRAEGSANQAPAPTRELIIRAQGGKEWNASIEDVEKVLRTTAAEMWKHFPDRKLHPILVQPKGGPIVLYQRGSKGEYIVRLNTGDTYWAQYAFQFAHEFTHILCVYREGDSGNLWLEESLCELASLYALRQMSQTWKTRPPYPNWKDYAAKLNDYADERLKKATLPEKMTLAQWYAENAESLSKEGTQREKNLIVAAALLPLIEKEPEHWAAVEHLNTGKTKEPRTFAKCLADWHANVPEKHKAFVKAVGERFGVKVDGSQD
jgi:hypothetical protein